MATRFVFTPAENEVYNAPPLMDAVQGRPVLSGPDGVSVQWVWTFVAPQGLTSPYTLVVHGIATGSGNLNLYAYLEAITPGDALQLHTGVSWGSDNILALAVPATSGYLFTVTIPLTNDDSVAPGDLVRLMIDRSPGDAADTLAGTFSLLAAEFRDSA